MSQRLSYQIKIQLENHTGPLERCQMFTYIIKKKFKNTQAFKFLHCDGCVKTLNTLSNSVKMSVGEKYLSAVIKQHSEDRRMCGCDV